MDRQVGRQADAQKRRTLLKRNGRETHRETKNENETHREERPEGEENADGGGKESCLYIVIRN